MPFAFLHLILSLIQCAELSVARQSYSDGRVNDAILVCDCHISSNPQNLEARRLKADILWWENYPESSKMEARAALRLARADFKDEESIYSLTKKLSDFRLSAAYEEVWGTRDTQSHEFHLESAARYFKKNELVFGFDQISRSYQNSDAFIDRVYRIDHLWFLTAKVYLLSGYSFAADAHFTPKSKFRLEPHLILPEGFDLGLGNTFSVYEDANSYLLKPMIEKSILDSLVLTVGSEIALHPENAMSGFGTLRWMPWHRLTAKAGVSGGKTDDGDGVIADFINYSVDIGFELCAYAQIHLMGSIYRADNRDEIRSGLAITSIF